MLFRSSPEPLNTQEIFKNPDLSAMPMENFGGEIRYISKTNLKQPMPTTENKASKSQTIIVVKDMEFHITPQTRFVDMTDNDIEGNHSSLKVGDMVVFTHYQHQIVKLRIENLEKHSNENVVQPSNNYKKSARGISQKIIFENGVYKNVAE